MIQGPAPGRIRPLVLLTGGAVCISFSPILVKAAGLEALGPTSIAFWRLALGAVALFGWAAARKLPLAMPAPLLGLAALAGVVFTFDLFLWHRAILLIGAGMATILGNTQVFNTALLGWLVFKERPGLKFFTAALLGLGGVALLVGIGSGMTLAGDHLRGLLFGLGTGVAYACYLVTTRAMTRRPEGPPVLTMVAWISLLGALACLAVCATESDPFLPATARVWLSLLGLGVLVQAVGWWAITAALPGVPGAMAGLVLLLQPVLATVWGWMLYGERLDTAQTVGAGLTLLAIYLGTVGLGQSRGRRQSRSRSPS